MHRIFLVIAIGLTLATISTPSYQEERTDEILASYFD
jgi:hypothetical protein